MEQLIIKEIIRDSDFVTAQITNSPRGTVDYKAGYIRIISDYCPEYTGNTLCIWGNNNNLDDALIQIPIEHRSKVLCSVYEFNHYQAASSLFTLEELAIEKNYQICCGHLWLDKGDCACQQASCYICGDIHSVDNMRKIKVSGAIHYICKSHKKTKICPHCDKKDYFLVPHSKYTAYSVCSKCMTATDVYWKEQNNYSYKPDPVFYDYDIKNKKIIKFDTYDLNKKVSLSNKFWMGHEVEQQYATNAVREVIIGNLNHMLGSFIYCKSDSSIGTNGTEVVTHPFSWEYYKSGALKGILNSKIVDWRGSDNQVGHHIHINNSAFSKLHLYRFLNFHHTHLNWVTFISQRRLTNFCKTTGGSLTKAFSKTGIDRYEFINLQNSRTIEWRAFASPITYEEFCKNTEYMYAVYLWTKDSSIQDLTVKNFEDYIIKEKNMFPNLFNFIAINKDKTTYDIYKTNVEEGYDRLRKNKVPYSFSDIQRVNTSINNTYTCDYCEEEHIGTRYTYNSSETGSLLTICPECAADYPDDIFICNTCGNTIIGEIYNHPATGECTCVHCISIIEAELDEF